MREDIENMKKELNEVKNESFATEILRDYKKVNKRMFIALIIVIILCAISNGCWFYYHTHYTTEEIITTETAETTGEGNACVGDNCSNGDVNNGKSD